MTPHRGKDRGGAGYRPPRGRAALSAARADHIAPPHHVAVTAVSTSARASRERPDDQAPLQTRYFAQGLPLATRLAGHRTLPSSTRDRALASGPRPQRCGAKTLTLLTRTPRPPGRPSRRSCARNPSCTRWVPERKRGTATRDRLRRERVRGPRTRARAGRRARREDDTSDWGTYRPRHVPARVAS